MKLGEKVKYFRKMRNFSQSELGEGICSVSYLSKIENGVTDPSEEIGYLLGKRLEVDLYNSAYSERKEEYLQLFYHLYNRDRQSADHLYSKLKKIPIEHTEDIILFNIFTCLYLLLSFNDTKSTKSLLEDVSYLAEGVKSEKSFYYFIAVGLREYYLNNFNSAYLLFKDAEEVIDTYQYKSWEKGYLYYLISLTSNRLRKNSICLDYGKLALSIFEARYDFKRCADCRILLGLIYQRTENWHESKKHFKMAETVANSFNDESLKGAIYQNLGYNESRNGNSEEAIKLYTLSLKSKEKQPVEVKVTTLFTLIKEYLKLGNYKKCINLILSGIELVRDKPNLYEYLLHFNHYHNLLNYGKYHEKTSEYLVEHVIPYLQKRNEWTYLVEYLQLVGDYYEHINRYKLSSFYYQETITILKKINLG